MGTQLSSDTVVRVGVGAVTDVQGAILTAPKVDFVRSAGADTSKDGELILGGSTNTTQTSHTEKTTTAGVWQAQSGNGETKQTYNQTQINGKVKIATGINTTVVIPEGDFKTQVLQLSQQPGMAYIDALAKNPKVNWTQVKLAYDKWEYSQEGLTPAGAALLAIAIAAYTGGIGAELLGGTAATSTSAATLMGSTVYGAAANAGFAALASSAGVSFVNNGGDIGKTLKDMGSSQNVKGIVLAMVSAGVLSDLNTTMGLDKVKVTDGFTANLNKAVINNLANATMTSAITGTPLEDNIKTGLVSALISAGSGQAANGIGELTIPGVNGQPPTLNAAGQLLAHALAGCMAGAASGGKQGCQSGSVGAVIGELTAQWVNPTGDPAKAAETINIVKVVSAAAGALTGDGSAASVSTAVMTGVNAAENNWLSTRQKVMMMTELNAADSALEKAKIAAKYALISGRQDVLTAAGVGKGLAESGWSDVKGMAEFLSDPVKGLQGLQQLVTDPQTRAALGDQIVNDFTAKIDRMNKALEVGGDANAVQLGQDLGSLVWQVGSVVTGVAGTAKASTMLASAGVKVGAEVLENSAIKLSTFNAGSIQGYKSAEAINAMMNAAEGWSPAWKPGTAVAEMTVKEGTTVKMVVSKADYQAILDGKTERAFGGWATFDDVSSQAYAKDQLAITSSMKADVGYVVELKIKQPINAQVGVVGAQDGAAGGGNQLHFLVNPADRSKLFELVPGSGRALQ